MTVATTSAECDELLAEAERFHPLYGDRLASHLPMALVAMDRMGATPAQLRRFFDAYAAKLRPRDAPAPPADPLPLLGAGEGFEGLFAFFREAARADGVEAVLRRWVPILAPGLAASAFHAMIRLAYALEARREPEICQALAFWALAYQPLPLSPARAPGSPEAIAAALSRAVAGHRYAPGIIVDRMLELARHPALAHAAIQPEALELADVAGFALGAYARTEGFTLLHTVTACHAFRVVAPYLGDPEPATRWLWQAVLTAFLTTGPAPAPEAPAGDPGDERDWGRCRERAIETLDDHVIKLTYTAWQESRVRPDARYLLVARRKTSPAA